MFKGVKLENKKYKDKFDAFDKCDICNDFGNDMYICGRCGPVYCNNCFDIGKRCYNDDYEDDPDNDLYKLLKKYNTYFNPCKHQRDFL